MSGFLLEQQFPGATTSILIGPLDPRNAAFLNRHRAVQWWIDGESLPRGFGPDARRPGLEIVRVEQLPITEFEPAIERFLGRDARRLPSLYVTEGVAARHAGAYAAAIDAIHGALTSHQVARITRQRDGFAWQLHLLRNLPAYLHRRLPSTWQGAMRGWPAFVCGAGPSLDVTAPRLAAVAERGVVLAADSALRALARHGVAVDFAVSIDVAKHPEKCLPSGHPPDRLIVATVSPPSWSQAVPSDRCFYVAGPQVTEDWLESHGIRRPAVAARENCGSTALELARFLGCTPIYLFGLDLSVDPADQTRRHNAAADGTVYANSGYNPAQALPTVPGNHTARVPTFAAGDWRALDERIASWPAGLVFNVNDRGARFRNTTVVRPDEFALTSTAPEPKSLALARLSTPDGPPPAGSAVFSRLRTVGIRANSRVEVLRSALVQGGPPEVVRQFRELFLDQDIARVLGSFSFKLMPHLLPPLEGDTASWRGMIEEFAELAATAAQPGREILKSATAQVEPGHLVASPPRRG